MVGAAKITTQVIGTGSFGSILVFFCSVNSGSDITAILVAASAFGVSLVGGCLANSWRAHFAVLVLSLSVLIAGIVIFGRTVEPKFSCQGRDSGVAEVVF